MEWQQEQASDSYITLPEVYSQQSSATNIRKPKAKVPVPAEEIEAAIQQVENVFCEELSLCPFCSRSFTKNAALVAHIRHHGADRKFICSICRKGFTQAANLRNHERSHRNERPYICGDCGKAFTQITNLNNHRRLHTGERPFVCIEKDCGRSFAQVTNLNNHMKTHYKVQQYGCIHCPARFTQVSQLNVHMANHEGFEGLRCPHCPDREFKQQGQLQHHLRQHGVDFPYACDQCEEKFLQSVHLEKHKKVHEDPPTTSRKPASFKARAVTSTNTPPKRTSTRLKTDAGSSKTPIEIHECYFDGCDLSFPDEGSLRTHLDTAHGFHTEGQEGEHKKRRVKEEPAEDIPSHSLFLEEYQEPEVELTPPAPRRRGRPRKTVAVKPIIPDVGHFMEIMSTDVDPLYVNSNAGPGTYSCQYCSRVCKTLQARLKHERKFHSRIIELD